MLFVVYIFFNSFYPISALADIQLDYAEKSNASPKNSAKKKKNKSKDDDDEPSSEEERWLHAIEAGKLEEVELLKLNFYVWTTVFSNLIFVF